jgi:hypothetical protein
VSALQVGVDRDHGLAKIFAHVIETEAEEMLDFSARLHSFVAAGNRSQTRDGHDIAFLIDGAGFSQPAHLARQIRKQEPG